jgi:hypothetical protein
MELKAELSGETDQGDEGMLGMGAGHGGSMSQRNSIMSPTGSPGNEPGGGAGDGSEDQPAVFGNLRTSWD